MQTKTLLIGRKPILEAIQNNQKIDKILIAPQVDNEHLKEIFQQARALKIVIQRVPIEKINKITRANHQGVIAFLSIVPYYDLQSLIDLANDKGETPLFLLLEGVTDVRNIGGIVRTAYSYGIHGIIIPENGVAPLREDAMKTSVGTLSKINICRVKYLSEAIQTLKLNGIKIIGTDLKSDILLEQSNVTIPCAFVIGSEDTGISTNVLNLCDEKIKIPLQNDFDSLNVSVATGICLYSVFLKRNLLK